MMLMPLAPGHILLAEAIGLLTVWMVVALLLRTEGGQDGLRPRPVVLLVVVAVTCAFILQTITAYIPAFGTHLGERDIEDALFFLAGALRGVALVLLISYITYRWRERRGDFEE